MFEGYSSQRRPIALDALGLALLMAPLAACFVEDEKSVPPQVIQPPTGPGLELFPNGVPSQGDLAELPDSIRSRCEDLVDQVLVTGDGDSEGAPSPFGPNNRPTNTPPIVGAPPRPAKPTSGGTLLVTRDQRFAIASDPDRDQVYVVDLASAALLHTVALELDDEPGRLVEDSHGQVHVVLRGAGDVVTIDPEGGQLSARRSVCENGRGIDYRASDDSLFVACMEGVLAQLPARVRDDGADEIHLVEVPVGARDVGVDGEGRVRVSLFRSAVVLELGENPMSGASTAASRWTPGRARYASSFGPSACRVQRFSPSVAFRTHVMPDGTVAMLHERSKDTEVRTAPDSDGYGGGNDHVLCGSAIVQSAVTIKRPGMAPVSAVVPRAVLPVDMAVSTDGSQLAIVAPANKSQGSPQLLMLPTAAFDRVAIDPTEKFVTEDNAFEGCAEDAMFAFGVPHDVEGELTAVAFNGDTVVVQSREPASLQVVREQLPEGRVVVATIALSDESVADTGHALFHMDAGGGIACASCHPEGGDDGHVWNFAEFGERRTQHLRGGLLGSEPFHWQGDMQSFQALFDEVFVGRMGGFSASPDQVDLLAHWIDDLPAYRKPITDLTAVARGETVFHSAATGCAGCHAGAQLRINEGRDVGTGQAFQVPSLRGVVFRAPYMHDGCASTLAERFSSCGGEQHGGTARLDAQERSDLVSYLEAL